MDPSKNYIKVKGKCQCSNCTWNTCTTLTPPCGTFTFPVSTFILKCVERLLKDVDFRRRGDCSTSFFLCFISGSKLFCLTWAHFKELNLCSFPKHFPNSWITVLVISMANSYMYVLKETGHTTVTDPVSSGNASTYRFWALHSRFMSVSAFGVLQDVKFSWGLLTAWLRCFHGCLWG